MSYVFQSARLELDKAIQKNAQYVRGKILDIGAGPHDRYSRYFEASEYVRMNIEPGSNTQLVGKIEKIPAENDSFEGILCTQVIGDVLDLREAFLEMNRVLKPGGRILLTEGFFDAPNDEPHDYWRFTPHSLRRLCEEAGFKVMVIERLGGYWSVREQMRARYWIAKYDLYHARYGRWASFMLKLLGNRAIRRDARDPISQGLGIAHGFLVVAEKN